jgi:hypothetical protein
LNPQLDCEIRIKFFGSTKVTPTAVDATTLELARTAPRRSCRR